jgi:hypothetical protein
VLANAPLLSNLPVVLAGNLGMGHVVLSGMDPDYHYYYNLAPGAGKLLRNMFTWLAKKGNWLSVTPSSGTVPPGSSQNVSVLFNAKKINGGDYWQVISINSNDPLNNLKNIPANMHVIGAPAITVLPDTIKSGQVFVGVHYIDTITVENVGSDILNISSITSSIPVFTVDKTNFSIPPGEESAVAVTFIRVHCRSPVMMDAIQLSL